LLGRSWTTLVVMSRTIALRISRVANPSAAVERLRRVVATPVAALASAVRNSQPIALPDLFTRSHDEDEKDLLALLEGLEAMGASFELQIDGRIESRQYLSNILKTWRGIQYDGRMEQELASDEPSEEALRWGSGKRRKNDD